MRYLSIFTCLIVVPIAFAADPVPPNDQAAFAAKAGELWRRYNAVSQIKNPIDKADSKTDLEKDVAKFRDFIAAVLEKNGAKDWVGVFGFVSKTVMITLVSSKRGDNLKLILDLDDAAASQHRAVLKSMNRFDNARYSIAAGAKLEVKVDPNGAVEIHAKAADITKLARLDR